MSSGYSRDRAPRDALRAALERCLRFLPETSPSCINWGEMEAALRQISLTKKVRKLCREELRRSRAYLTQGERSAAHYEMVLLYDRLYKKDQIY